MTHSATKLVLSLSQIFYSWFLPGLCYSQLLHWLLLLFFFFISSRCMVNMLLSSQSRPPVNLLASPLNFQDLGHLFSHYSEIVFRKTSYLFFFCLFWCVFIMYLHRLRNSIPFHLVYFFFNFIFKLYNILLVLPNIKMCPPQVYMCSTSWTLLPPPSPYHPSGSSQSTSPKNSVLCIEPGLVTHFIYDIIRISMPFSHIIPPSPSPTESKRLFYTSVSLLLSLFDSMNTSQSFGILFIKTHWPEV